MTVIETTVIVSRRDADVIPVVHVRDEWTFDTPEEQKEFTEEMMLWLDDRPMPGGVETATFPRKGYKGEIALMQTLDKVLGVDTESSIENMPREEELDVPSFMQDEAPGHGYWEVGDY